MRASKRKILLPLLIVVLLAFTAYALADRYLIRHVEIANVNAYAYTMEATLKPTLPVENSTLITAQGAAVTNESAADSAAEEAAGTGDAEITTPDTADDWNYQSDAVSITVRQNTSGSGGSALTYFVADVVVQDATRLRSAFADNQFGRNIIAATSEIARENHAVFAINGDYYGFRTDGIEIRNGVIYRDEPARTGLAFYRDGSMKIYDETQTSAEDLLAEGVWNTVSFGPALVEDGEVADFSGKVSIDTNVGNHSIQGKNPRTGVGIIDANHFVFIVVDGRSRNYSQGVTLAEFAAIFKKLGCTQAYNIDGGGSSTMYFMGRVVNNPLGRESERGTSDILFIGS
jgi:exopolysaccharide biosynthesis protein